MKRISYEFLTPPQTRYRSMFQTTYRSIFLIHFQLDFEYVYHFYLVTFASLLCIRINLLYKLLPSVN